MGKKHKINCFLIGAPKCGTSTLYELFNSCDEIETSEKKELHFFSRDKVLKSPYKVYPPRSINDYHQNYKFKRDIIVDTSPSYWNDDKALERIKNYNPSSKIIILYRDPIERVISHFSMDKNLGIHRYNSILDAIIDPMFFDEYINNSMFHERIKSLKNHFNTKQILVLSISELNNIPELNQKLENFFKTSINLRSAQTISNKSFKYRSSWIRQLVKVIPRQILDELPQSFKNSVKNKLTSTNHTKHLPTSEELNQLNRILSNDYKNFKKEFLYDLR